MTEQEKLSLANDARPFSNRLIAVIGLSVFVCPAIIFIAGYRNLAGFPRWSLISFLILFAFFGATVSLWLTRRESRRAEIVKSGREIFWQTTSPENQKGKLNCDVRELGAILDISGEKLNDLLSAYIVAEDLALRKIQQEEGTPALRHISINQAEFDAVLLNNETVKFVEVVFLATPDFPQKKINTSAGKILSVKKFIENNYSHLKINLLFLIVSQLDQTDTAKLRSTLSKERFSIVPVDIDINFYDFEELQKVYAID